MNGPRTPTESEMPRVLEFLNTHLRPAAGWSIAQEYPQVFADPNRGNIRIVTEDNRIVAHAVSKILLVKAPAGLFKVAAIGSVVTDPAYRNRGLSGQVLDEILAGARAQGCDFAVLWTNLYDHYRKFGFELAGSEVSAVIENEFEAPASGLRFIDSQRVSPEAILKLYSSHTVGTLRSVEDVRQFLQIPNARVYTAWDEQNILQAYAVEGRGADLEGYIHEWGGGVSKILPLLAHIRRVQKRPITVILPQHSVNLLQKLRQLPCVINEGYLGMVKFLDTRNLFFKVHRYARAVGVYDLILDHKDGQFTIGVKGQALATREESDMVQLLLGPASPVELLPSQPELARELEKVLPLPMWIWGWDSV